MREIFAHGIRNPRKFCLWFLNPRLWNSEYRGLFPGAPSKTSDSSKANSPSVEQTLSYFTVDDLLNDKNYCFHR